MTSALEIRSASKRFGRKIVLNGLDLSVPEGVVAVLLGKNGVGKTTLLRAAVGMISLDSGSIRTAGFLVDREPVALKQVVGFVPDIPDVYPWMTTTDLFRFLRPIYRTWSDREADGLADAFQVPRNVRFRDLSRGQAVKALLAAALAPRPAVLLVDEPFGGLDPIARDEVLRNVVGELRTESRTIVCSTHDLAVAARLADLVAIMVDGRVARIEQVDDLIRSAGDAPAPTALRDAFDAACAESRS